MLGKVTIEEDPNLKLKQKIHNLFSKFNKRKFNKRRFNLVKRINGLLNKIKELEPDYYNKMCDKIKELLK